MPTMPSTWRSPSRSDEPLYSVQFCKQGGRTTWRRLPGPARASAAPAHHLQALTGRKHRGASALDLFSFSALSAPC